MPFVRPATPIPRRRAQRYSHCLCFRSSIAGSLQGVRDVHDRAIAGHGSKSLVGLQVVERYLIPHRRRLLAGAEQCDLALPRDHCAMHVSSPSRIYRTPAHEISRAKTRRPGRVAQLAREAFDTRVHTLVIVTSFRTVQCPRVSGSRHMRSWYQYLQKYMPTSTFMKMVVRIWLRAQFSALRK